MQRGSVAQILLLLSRVGSVKLDASPDQYNAHFKYNYIGYNIVIYIFFFLLVQQPAVGEDLLIHEVSRSHTKTRHSW